MAVQFKLFAGRSSKTQKKGERQKSRWQSAVNDAEYWMNNEAVEVMDVKCHVTQGKSRVVVVVLYRPSEFSPRPHGRGRYSLHLVVSSSGSNETWQRTLNLTAGELAQIAHQQFYSQGVAPSGELISCSFSQISHHKKDAASSVRLICTGEPRRRRGQGEVKFRIAEALGNQWGWVLDDATTVVQKIVDEGGTVVDVDMVAVEQRSYTSPTSLMIIAYTEAPTRAARPSTPVTLEFVPNSTGSRPQPLAKHFKPQPTLWEKELPLLAEAADRLAQVDRLICTAFAPWQCEQGGPAWMLVVSYDTAPPAEQFAIAEQSTLRATSPRERRRLASPRPIVHKMKRGESLVGRAAVTPGELARSWSPNPRAPSPTVRSPSDGARPFHTASSRRPVSPFNRTTAGAAHNAPSYSQLPTEIGASYSGPDLKDSLTQIVESRLKTYSKTMGHPEPEPEPEFLYAAASPGALSGVELAVAYREHLSQTGSSAMDIAPMQDASLDEAVSLTHGSGTAAANSRVGKARGFKPVHNAAYDGDVAALLKCVQNGAAIDRGDRQKNTPLHVACERGHVNVVDALLATGFADPNSRNARMETPLHVAAAHGQLHVIKRLLDSGRAPALGHPVADDNARDIEGRHAAELAEQNHFHDVAAYLRGQDTLLSQWNRGVDLHTDDDDEPGSVRPEAEAIGAQLSRQFAQLPLGSVDSKYSPPPPSPVPRNPKRTMSEGLAAAHDVLLAYKGHDAAEQPRATVAAAAGYGEVSTPSRQKTDETSTEGIMRLAKTLDESELGIVIAALSKQREDLKAARKRVQSGTKKRRDADLYRTSLEKLSVEELRLCAKNYDVDRQVSLIITSSSKSTEAKALLIDLLMSRYMEIVHRGGEPPRPITSATGTTEPGLSADAHSPRAAPTNLRRVQAVHGAVTAHGQPNVALQFSEQSPAPSARGEAETPDKRQRFSNLDAGQHLDHTVSENLKFDAMVSGGPWYLCELYPTTPEGIAARLPEKFGRVLFWNKSTQLYYDSRAPPHELAVEVEAKVLGHESLQVCEQVLGMLGSTGFPEAHARTYGLLERYVERLHEDAPGSPLDDGRLPTNFREVLWAQSSRGGDPAAASGSTNYLEPEPEPEPMIGSPSSRSPTSQPRAHSPTPSSPVSLRALEFSYRGSPSGSEPARREALGVPDSNAVAMAEGLPPQREMAQQAPHQQPARASSRYEGTRLEKQMEMMRAERQAAKDAKRAAKRLAKEAAN